MTEEMTIDEMYEIVKNLGDVAYYEFCYRFDIDSEDAQEMSWFIADHYNDPQVVSWLRKNHDKVFDYEFDDELWSAENWGGDPDGKLAKALERARKKAKEPRKPLKIERLKAESFNSQSSKQKKWVMPDEAYPRHMRTTDNDWAKDFYCDKAWVERHGDEYTLHWDVRAYKPTKVQRPAVKVFSQTYPYTTDGWFNGYMRWAKIPMRGKNWSEEVQEKLGSFVSKRAESFSSEQAGKKACSECGTTKGVKTYDSGYVGIMWTHCDKCRYGVVHDKKEKEKESSYNYLMDLREQMNEDDYDAQSFGAESGDELIETLIGIRQKLARQEGIEDWENDSEGSLDSLSSAFIQELIWYVDGDRDTWDAESFHAQGYYQVYLYYGGEYPNEIRNARTFAEAQRIENNSAAEFSEIVNPQGNVVDSQTGEEYPPLVFDAEFNAKERSMAKKSWDTLNNIETAVGTIGLAHMIGLGAIFGGTLAFLKGRKSNSKTEK